MGLEAGGWWLVAGGWWLVAGGWWLVAGGWMDWPGHSLTVLTEGICINFSTLHQAERV
ncbi:hypothetical protein [Erwinia mallotivora]|uniref:hypothetical protein n=1 Tax=Erwinia mallotivora TaxID=69222 RepID=UPI0021BE1122|nr:hypothetical protein [Erwinia mallotivora]